MPSIANAIRACEGYIHSDTDLALYSGCLSNKTYHIFVDLVGDNWDFVALAHADDLLDVLLREDSATRVRRAVHYHADSILINLTLQTI